MSNMNSTSNGSRDQVYQPVQTPETEMNLINSLAEKPQTVIKTADTEDPWDEDDDDDIDDVISKINIVSRSVVLIQKCVKWAYGVLRKVTRGYLVTFVCLAAYLAYFITAMCYRYGDEGSRRLLGMTILGVFIKIRHRLVDLCKRIAHKLYGATSLNPKDENRLSKIRFFARWLSYGGLAAVVAWMLIDEGKDEPNNLRSLPGLVLFNLVPAIFSKRPSKIDWHIIYWSNGLQFLFAYIVLKWTTGKESILWVQNRFDSYFENTKAGSLALFGPTYTDHQIIFNSMPILFFSGATLAVLYYVGAMQFIINALSQVFKLILGTSKIESTAVALGIFTEGVTTMMMIRPFLMTLTKSEMFTVITSCFTSLGGAYMAVLASMGVSLEYILPSMLVSAPACFTVCKLLYPERKKGDTAVKDEEDIFAEEKNRYTNILDAFQGGAMSTVSFSVNSVVMMFIFFSIITWINSSLGWFGDRVGVDNLTVEFICSYLLYPVALAMGVDTVDCRRVALVLGYRICFINFMAFFKLAEMKGNKYQYMLYMMGTNGTGPVSSDGMDYRLDLWNTTLKNGFLKDRSEAILTYSLCGFSSIMVVGIFMSVLILMVPERKAWLTRVTIPALIAANVANCMTGCYASLFY